jgi:hypothetical protein
MIMWHNIQRIMRHRIQKYYNLVNIVNKIIIMVNIGFVIIIIMLYKKS